MIKSFIHAYGQEMDSEFEYLFTHLRKTHNQGVFMFTHRICCAAVNLASAGLPDGYGRGALSVTIAA
ncbi:hypothetical protein ACNKHW_19785 [Shigella flexneri]